MPVVALHTRTPSGFEAADSTPAADSADISSPAEPGKSKRLAFLRHLKPGSRTPSTEVSPRVGDKDGLKPPSSPAPIKRSTAPADESGRPRLEAPGEQRIRARSISPRSPVTSRPRDGLPDLRQIKSNGGTIPQIKRPSVERPLSNGSVVSYDSYQSSERAASPESRGVRFAGVPDDQQSSRPKRQNGSSAASRRKSSIYFRNNEGGGFVDGVEHGVGTKARRLSVLLPQELYVDEDRLEDFFDLIQRLNKKKIGEGGAACVQLMKSKKAGDGDVKSKFFAVKEFRPWDSEEENELDYKRKIKSEFSISKACQHPNIVKTFRLCYSGEEWFHVMEYCELGDLNDLIKAENMTQEDRNCFFKQLLRGVDYLHSRGISHRDLKSENLLVNAQGCLKIADFGTSEVFCGEHPGARNCRRPSIITADQDINFCQPGIIGSRPYMAPELVERKHPYDPRAVDVWSCAIVYLTLCFNGTPWSSASADQNNYNIFCASWDEWLVKHPDGKIEVEKPLPTIASSKLMKFTTPHAKTIVMGMLNPDPNHRWTVKKALDMVSSKEGYGPWPCCQQDGYSDDIKLREKKANHNHIPPDRRKKNGEFNGKLQT